MCEALSTSIVRNITFLLILFVSPVSVANSCFVDIKEDEGLTRIFEVKDFVDLNGDGILEKIAFSTGGASDGMAYSSIYTKTKEGCFVRIFGGSENVSLGAIPQF